MSAPAPRWTEVQAALNKAGLRSVAVDAVETLLADGFTLVDVRPRADFEAYHAPGSVSVPLFGPIVLDSPAKFAKRLLFAMNGMPGACLRLGWG